MLFAAVHTVNLIAAKRRPTRQGVTRVIPHSSRLRAILSALAWLALPSVAMAQGAVAHDSVYTAIPSDITAGRVVARSAMKLVNPTSLPLAMLMSANARPAGMGPAGSIAAGGGVVATPDASGEYSPLSIAPYTTAGAYATFGGPQPNLASVAVTSYPWRATGKLFFDIDGEPYVCSGSMIAPGLLLTAAHCVFEYGMKSGAGWHTNFVFYPGLADYGVLGSWTARSEIIPEVYYNGTDNCYQVGVVCNNDLAIIVMNKNAAGELPGTRTSTYGYGWNGYAYITSFGRAFLGHLTQLGYPQSFDSGRRMERTDGIGALWSPGGGFYNALLGSAQTGGSSGGPWLVNFGTRPSVDYNATLGASSNSNIVVGVTSWGYGSVGNNTVGASWFGQNAQYPSTYTDTHGHYRGAGNIGFIVSYACSHYYDHC